MSRLFNLLKRGGWSKEGIGCRSRYHFNIVNFHLMAVQKSYLDLHPRSHKHSSLKRSVLRDFNSAGEVYQG